MSCARWRLFILRSNLCLTGGVALTCVANARILHDTDYQRVWVPPCASDSGAPLGSALWHYHQTLGYPRQFEMTHPFYGLAYSDGEIMSALDEAGLSYQRLDERGSLRRWQRSSLKGGSSAGFRAASRWAHARSATDPSWRILEKSR